MNTLQAPPNTQPQYEITDDDRARAKRIQEAWKAYEDEFEKPFDKMPDEPDMNVISNRVVEIVNGSNDFLFGKEIQITPEQNAPQDAQKFLDTVWGRKEARIPFLLRLGLNGANAGNAFLRIVPGRKKGNFRLVEVDPAIVNVKTAPQDCQTVLLWCIEYCCDEKDPATGKFRKIYYREEISRIDPVDEDDFSYEDEDADGLDSDVTWQIQHWTQETSSGMAPKNGNWQPAGNPYIWPYPFPPIFSCQNLPRPNSFWGYPDATKGLIALNNALNLVQSGINIERKIRRILFAPGTGEGTMHVEPGKIVQLPLPEQKIEAVQASSEIASDLQFAANLRSDMDEMSGIPGVATGRVDILPRGITGVAIEMLYGPALKKTDKKRCLYGEMIIEVSKALLVLNNMSEDIDISISWESPIPVDDLQTVQAYVLLKSIGVSNSSIMRKLGYDPEEEMKLSQEEDAKMMANNQQIMQQENVQQAGMMPPAEPGTPTLPGQPHAQQSPLQGGSQQSQGVQ